MVLEGLRSSGYVWAWIIDTGDFMASDNDMRAHQDTYVGVMGFLKWGTIACALVSAFVVFLIAK